MSSGFRQWFLNIGSLVLLVVILFWGCQADDDPEPPPPTIGSTEVPPSNR